jgi:hypothetical protein
MGGGGAYQLFLFLPYHLSLSVANWPIVLLRKGVEYILLTVLLIKNVTYFNILTMAAVCRVLAAVCRVLAAVCRVFAAV